MLTEQELQQRLGPMIRRWVATSIYTQEGVAMQMGLSRPALSAMMSGTRCITLWEFARLCAILGKSLPWTLRRMWDLELFHHFPEGCEPFREGPVGKADAVTDCGPR